ASPCGAPPASQDAMVFTSASESRGSLRKWPNLGSACHGRIFRDTTAALIALAQGRALSYVNRENGAASPGRWQPWQLFCTMGKTSLLNVAESVAPRAFTATARTITRNRGRIHGNDLIRLACVPGGGGRA